MINLCKDLKAFLQAEYKSPVISLYVRLTADKVAPEPKALVRSFRSMKAQELKGREDFVGALPRTVSELLTCNLEEIETFLADYFVPNVPGVNVTMVEFREDLLAAYQGIAVILYPHTASALASA